MSKAKKPAAGGKPGMDTEMKYVTMKIVGGEAPSNAVLSEMGLKFNEKGVIVKC